MREPEAPQRPAAGVARHWPLVLVAGSFLIFGLLALGNYGLTWDEPHSYRGAEANVRFLMGEIPFEHTVQPIERMPGFYFVFNSTRGVIARLFGALFGWGPIRSHHLFNLLIATACIVWTYRVVLQVSGAVRPSAFAAAALATLPPFVGHSQNNPKDLPAVLCYLACASLLIAVAKHGRRRDAVAAAAALGVAFTTRVICVFVVPLTLLWLAIRWRSRLRRHAGSVAASVAASVPIAVACWPWLWDDPLGRLVEVAGLVSVWGEGRGLYLGRLVDLREMPWHYLPVHLLVALPLLFLTLAAFAPLAAGAWRRTERRYADAVWLGLVWVGVLLLAEQLSARRYDGLRHFLAILPGVAILAALGLEWLVGGLERGLGGTGRPRRLEATGLVAACGVLAATMIAAVHPYEAAFMNTIANAVGGPRTEEWLEVEYWGGAYREGVEWLETHAEPGADVCVPIASHLVSAQSRVHSIQPACRSEWFRDGARPAYLMFITRRSWYDETPIEAIESEYEPVFEIRSQRATLLRIYSNRGPKKREAPRSS